jgi:hypothetical protein
MKQYRLTILVGAAFLALSACTASQLQTAQTDIAAGIQAACTDVMAAQKLNPASAVSPWATSSCGTATAVAGLVQTSATLQWLGTLQGQLAAPVAAAAPAA